MRHRRSEGRGSGGVRDVSPRSHSHSHSASKSKDHRSEWRHYSPAARRPRRSVSPTGRERRRRSPSADRRDYASRRSDHGKQHQQQQKDDRLPSHHSRDRPPAFDDDSYEPRRKYVLPDIPTGLNPEPNSGIKLSRVILGDDDFYRPGNGTQPLSSSGLRRQDLLGRKPRYLDDGSLPTTLLPIPQSPGRSYPLDAPMLNNFGSSATHLKYGLSENDVLRGRDGLRGTYSESEKDKSYTREVSYPMIPVSELSQYGSSSSSVLAQEDFAGLSRGRLHLPPDGFGGGGASRFVDDPLDHNAYTRMHPVEPMGQSPLSPPERVQPRGYNYTEVASRARVDAGLLASDDLHRKMSWGPQGASGNTLSSRFIDLDRDNADGQEPSQRNANISSFWQECYSSHQDHYVMKGIHEDHVSVYRSPRVGVEMRLSRGHERAPFEEGYELGRDASLTSYRGRPRSPPLPDRRIDTFRQSMSPPREMSHIEDLTFYNRSPERFMERRYPMDTSIDRNDSRGILYDGRNSFRHTRELSAGDGPWYDEERAELLPSRSLAFGRAHYRAPSGRTSGPEAWLRPLDSSTHEEDGHDLSLKRRLRFGPPEFHGSVLSERRHEFSRPYKFWKKGPEERHGGVYSHDVDVPDDEMLFAKTDPPEGSEEFTKQVNKAFLRFMKFLYGSPFEQKRYREPEKGSVLICCVCGRLSKEFTDTHSLVKHAYRSLKVGLRTDHLGLHKALCVLMDWNWLIPPDNPRLYHFYPPETKSLKEDLILWPPIVIIHNCSIGNKNNADGPRIITNEGLEEILTAMGFEAGKFQVCRGKPANQSILLVKFMPTFSGLQEAERLHKHYSNKCCGRKEFQKFVTSTSSSESVGAAKVDMVVELLYGYMAIAEDLDKIDPGTKKRCLVKSKKDIEAIADAPLDTD